MERSISTSVREDLAEKLVLVSGPRQVGKTTLAKSLFSDSQAYFNFDVDHDRKIIRERTWPRDVDLVVFDELHKMRNWKRWLKGIYDDEGVQPSVLVTGSARMDAFRKTGDSLAGRHFHYRLHPLSVKEIASKDPDESLSSLLRYGNFPEPFLRQSESWSRRWRRTHLDRILREDLLDLENVRNLKLIEILVQLLAERVGSPVSYSSLARDLEISPHTVKRYIQILELLYVVFVITPYSKKISRSLLKEPKIYFFDCGQVQAGDSAKLENLVACHLLKRINFLEDTEGYRYRLHYLRDKQKREVDFLCVKDSRPEWLIEVKSSDDQISKNLKYFHSQIAPASSIQLVRDLPRRKSTPDGIRVEPLAGWLSVLET